MKKRIYNIFVLSFFTGLSIWLFLYDKAVEPGDLISAHEEIADCKTCHIPWRGVNNEMCLQCHEFTDVSILDQEIRFHEAKKYCLKCHLEHQGSEADISRVDHTLFNGGLLCTQCHFDRHDGLFGSACRECHGISTWSIKGFRHPPEVKKNCNRCHRPPQSHNDVRYWAKIEKEHLAGADERETGNVSPRECWLCHTLHTWSHLKIKHE